MSEKHLLLQKAFLRKSTSWTPSEELILQQIVRQEGPNNWNSIAERLFALTNKKLRTGKQVRQRYMNFLKFGEGRGELLRWTAEQIQKLFFKYKEFGSKWALIAKDFSHKSQNCLKNKFYSSLRLLARRLSELGKRTNFNKKELKYESILKPVEYQAKPGSEIFCGGITLEDLRIKIINAAQKGIEAFPEQEMLELIYCINRFNLSTRRSSKIQVSRKERTLVCHSKDQESLLSSHNTNAHKSDKATNECPYNEDSFELQIKPVLDESINLIDFTFYELEEPIKAADSLWSYPESQEYSFFLNL